MRRWQNDEQKSVTCRPIVLRLRSYDGQRAKVNMNGSIRKWSWHIQEVHEVWYEFPPSGGWNDIFEESIHNKNLYIWAAKSLFLNWTQKLPQNPMLWWRLTTDIHFLSRVFVRMCANTLMFTTCYDLHQFHPFGCHQHWPMNHSMKRRRETRPTTPCTQTHTWAHKHTHTLSLVSEKI